MKNSEIEMRLLKCLSCFYLLLSTLQNSTPQVRKILQRTRITSHPPFSKKKLKNETQFFSDRVPGSPFKNPFLWGWRKGLLFIYNL